jgi:hypothetical protein
MPRIVLVVQKPDILQQIDYAKYHKGSTRRHVVGATVYLQLYRRYQYRLTISLSFSSRQC